MRTTRWAPSYSQISKNRMFFYWELQLSFSLFYDKTLILITKLCSYTKDFHKENKEKMKMREQEAKQKIEDEKANGHPSNISMIL